MHICTQIHKYKSLPLKCITTYPMFYGGGGGAIVRDKHCSSKDVIISTVFAVSFTDPICWTNVIIVVLEWHVNSKLTKERTLI